MNHNIAIIDYGVGNIKSIYNALKFNEDSVDVELVSNPEDLHHYSKIILPGVGAFKDAMNKIDEKGFKQSIIDEANNGKYILGICLGMQLLGTCSYEFGRCEGLNIIPGDVQSFDGQLHNVKIPHMGWNTVKYNMDDQLFNGIENASDFYFVHSFYFNCAESDSSLAVTDYGVNFTSIIKKGNVYGVQFHPEKSQKAGLRLIKNFILM